MNKKLLLVAIIVVFVTLGIVFDVGKYLDFDYLKSGIDTFREWYQLNAVLVISVFFIMYVISTALSLPGATILTLAAGALFGLINGTVIVSFASSIGATLAFLASRYFFRSSIETKFSDKLKIIDQGIDKEGAFYLFALRLVPFFPFFLINLLMGLTQFRTWTFYWVSQLGMLAGTIVYVNAGTQLASLQSASGILSPKIIGSFVLLGLFPLIAKYTLKWIQKRKKGHRV